MRVARPPPPPIHHLGEQLDVAAALAQRRLSIAPVMVDIPRITLPDPVADVLKEQDLKNPNEMDTTAYNEYSAAAIGGTLALFIIPLFDLFGFFGDFVFSALIGGGALAYLSLRKDAPAEYANKFGGLVMKGIDKGAEYAPTVKDKLAELVDKAKSSL